MNKYFMLGLAGLAFAACSNEEDAIINGNPTPEGTGAVTVRLVNPGVATTKTVGDLTTSKTLTGTIKVDLYDNQTEAVSQTIMIDATNVTTTKELTFWNVTKPAKLVVSMNGGEDSYSDVAIESLNGKNYTADKIPAYGETTHFDLTEETGSPVIGNDNGGDGAISTTPGTGTEQGANEGDQNKTYQIYTAHVTMAIPVARLEIGGLKHVDTGNTCSYSKLTIQGVYMDGLYTQGGTYAENFGTDADNDGFSDSEFSDGTETQNYCFTAKMFDPDIEDADNVSYGTGIPAVLYDIIDGTEDDRNFLKAGAKEFPANDDVFAYNVYPGAEMPQFKIYFDQSVSSDPESPLPAPRYAMITKYMKGKTELTAFEPGTIYQIESASLEDENIIGDEGGNTLYGVTVYVKEAEWTIVPITADWAE